MTDAEWETLVDRASGLMRLAAERQREVKFKDDVLSIDRHFHLTGIRREYARDILRLALPGEGK